MSQLDWQTARLSAPPSVRLIPALQLEVNQAAIDRLAQQIHAPVLDFGELDIEPLLDRDACDFTHSTSGSSLKEHFQNCVIFMH
jgi:hypothetical protein